MKIELSQERLDATIAALEAAENRLQQEAAALLRVTAGYELAELRLQQAKEATKLLEFYLSL